MTERSRRLADLGALRDRGVDPYPPRFDTDTTASQLQVDHASLPAGVITGEVAHVAGRVMLVRDHGGIWFATLRQGDSTVQLLCRRVQEAPEGSTPDPPRRGDLVGACGTVLRSDSGELSIQVDTLQLLAAALVPPGDKRGRPMSIEQRARRREADLFENPDSRNVFMARSAAVHALRSVLHTDGFVEVETPVFWPDAGGATARPFVTHHNALGRDLMLRVAPELFLKRLVVGGMDRVFELGRVFRNEGVSARHNPEFTMLEVYRAYADHTEMMTLVHRLVAAAAEAAVDGTVVQVRGRPVDLAQPWRCASMADLVREVTGVELRASMPVEGARAALCAMGLESDQDWGAGRCLVHAFSERVEAGLVEPTIVTGHPVETSPLARRSRDDPSVTDRFEVIVGGIELANAYSELNDPVEQRRRFVVEQCRRDRGDGEAGHMDEIYLEALEQGLPPTGGLGIGIDRLVMLLTGRESIRDVILFPTTRGEQLPATAAARTDIVPTSTLPTATVPGAHVTAVRLSGLVRVVAMLTTIVGVLTMLSAVPAISTRTVLLDQLITPLPLLIDQSVIAVGIGSCMVLLSGQLLRGKRRAWSIAMVLFGVSAVFSVGRGGEIVALTASVAMMLILLLTRSEFKGLADPPSLLRVARTVPRFLLLVYVYGVAALGAQHGTITPDFSLSQSLWAVTVGLFGGEQPYDYSGRFATLFPLSLQVLGVLGLFLLSWQLLRPAVHSRSGEGRARAAELVDRHGWDTLAPFALRSDRSHFFSSDGRAMVAYGYLGGFALVSGDPIGADASIPLVVDEFLEHCRHHGWQPAFLAAREVDVPLYAERGFRSFYLGDEAILDCRRFSLDADGMGPVRQTVRRVGRTHRFEMVAEATASDSLLASLEAISEQWRKGEDERGYTMTMGSDVGRDDPHRLLAIAWFLEQDGSERPVGFLRLVPTGDVNGRFRAGCTLDLMRRLPDAANGVTEYLISHAVDDLRSKGYARLSLNFAAFGRLLDNDVQLTRLDRLLRRVVDVINPYYQIRALRDFNEKFQPVWLPRVLIYADPADLPKVGLRYAWLEGFVSMRLIGRLLAGPAEVVEATKP